MRRNILRVLLHGMAACALGMCGLPILQSVHAQTPQQDQTNVTPKPKRARKSDATAATNPTTAAPAKTASDAEIQAAKTEGKVWVNTQTGVYHKGGKWFGATKQGKFMTEQEAVKAGYRAAKNEK
jgi:hypothetical protein